MDPAELIAAALQDDPMFVFIQPDELRRRRFLRWYVPRLYETLATRARVELVPDSAVALWIPPDSKLKPPLISRTALVASPFRLGFAALQRAMEFAAAVDEASRDQAQDAWRLIHVAVDPARRAQGHAASVLVRTLDEADTTGRRCFVAATAEPVLPFFASHGFEVTQHLRVEGLPQFWTLVRRPR